MNYIENYSEDYCLYWYRFECNECHKIFEKAIPNSNELVQFETDIKEIRYLPVYGRFGYLDLYEKMTEDESGNRIPPIMKEFEEKLSYFTPYNKVRISDWECPFCNSGKLSILQKEIILTSEVKWLEIDREKILQRQKKIEESIKWDDSNKKIMDIIKEIDDDKESQIPIKCPICNTSNAHIYMYRWDDNKNRGTIWTWCSNCRASMHKRIVKLPVWWENTDFVDVSELTLEPVFLEPKANLLDKHLRQLLDKRISEA